MVYSRKKIMYLCQYAKQHGFSFPKGFETRSAAWIQRHFNGIGAEWMPSLVRKFLSKLLRPMEAAAMVHDVEFLSKQKTFKNFTKANLRLFYNGIKSKCFFCGFAAAVICQFGGWTAWKEGKETMAYFYYYQEK